MCSSDLAHYLDTLQDDPVAALRAYEDARIPRTRRAQLGSRARARENHLVSPWSRLRRNVGAWLQQRLTAANATDPLAWIFSYDVATLNNAPSATTPTPRT